ncbi:MAG: C69 family dipeptidase [Marinifilaceae bacterium]|jgi:dipeptidase|nr:C69 family dipeptidase [Marinifilaceae bacterium]
MRKLFSLLALVALFISSATNSQACTNYLLTRGATTDGSNIITYAADSHVLYGELYFWPAADWAPGSMVKVYEWDTGKYLGEIPQVAHTYSVVGNMNEFQLAIGETTYGGRKELGSQKGALIDYGSLIYLALQRSKNAREAIKVMTELVEKYGYYSSGESFSICDPNEIWILEMIGKGEGQKGAVWVARQIPDGYVSGHANQARITTFPLAGKTSISSANMEKLSNKEITTVYSKDVISFAKEKAYFPKNGKNKNFSFSDSYAPVDFGAARFCEMRVWTFFNRAKSGMDKYFDYCKGNVKHDKIGYATNRMPLWIKPDRKIDVLEVMDFMRDHLEGTELDMSKDLGAGPFGNPYRWRPLTWKVDGQTYCNERVTATQQTGFSFVAQCRNWLPDAVGGINWFGVDDAASSVYFPVYCGVTRVPKSFAVGNGKMMDFTNKSAFWVFNQVTNLAYTRYNLIQPEITKKQKALEAKYKKFTQIIDLSAKKMFEQDKESAIEFLTDFSCNQGDNLTNQWRDFYAYLFTKYMDGNVKSVDPNPNNRNPKVEYPGYGEKMYKRIVNETGDQFKVIGGGH